MLVKAQLSDTPSVRRLLNVWTQLYTPNFQTLPFQTDPSLHADLVKTLSPEGRAETVAKLNKNIVAMRCEVASIQTNTLYAYLQNVMDLQEARRLAEASLDVYMKLIDLYQQNLLRFSSISTEDLLTVALRSDSNLPALVIPDIEQLATALEPVLLEFQARHTQSKDWRTLGFITTQLNFCNWWMLSKLTPVEQLLLEPYLRFIEEQVAHPWQRVCAAAANHSVDSSVLLLAEQMIPKCHDIAQTAYASLSRLLPRHSSRRGQLNDPGIAHSCVRDFKMFQAYLWLCVLEGRLDSVEQELLSLCVMVLPSVGVKWEMTQRWMPVLIDALIQHLQTVQQPLVLSYANPMHHVFLNAREQLDTPLSRQISGQSAKSPHKRR